MSGSPSNVRREREAANVIAKQDFVTVSIEGQLFGIPVLMVQDILSPQKITPVPLAPAAVEGSLNLRGRIVTAINVRTKLGISPSKEFHTPMNVVVESGGELYSLMVDSVGEVLSLPDDQFEANPATLDELWRAVSQGIYRLEGQLLVILNVASLLSFETDTGN
ncbi:MAG: chemotaxis protein CheW [Holosporales bacterium]